jgi:nucleoid-associated protein YgaU
MTQLTFQRLDLRRTAVGTPMTVTYAPTELAFAKTATYAEVAIPGLEQPLLQFVRGEAETLSLELFFDSTGTSGTGAHAVAVTAEVEAFHKLVAVQSTSHAPTLVRVTWGQDFPGVAMGDSAPGGAFTGVVLSVARRFTLFNPDGKPLRALVTVALKHYATLAEQLATINLQSADHTRVHVVADGETLPLIAHDAYADAGLWRVIADHNRLTDVRDLAPGTRLEIPPLVAR